MRTALLAITATCWLVESAPCQTNIVVAVRDLDTKPTNALVSATATRELNWGGYVPDDKYKLRVGDKVSFQILEDRDAPRALVLADSGELDVPYLGRIAAADKTCKQLAREIKEQLEKEYYYRASVVLALDTANRLLGRVYVWGQVKNQGPLDLSLNENLTAAKPFCGPEALAILPAKRRSK